MAIALSLITVIAKTQCKHAYWILYAVPQNDALAIRRKIIGRINLISGIEIFARRPWFRRKIDGKRFDFLQNAVNLSEIGIHELEQETGQNVAK